MPKGSIWDIEPKLCDINGHRSVPRSVDVHVHLWTLSFLSINGHIDLCQPYCILFQIERAGFLAFQLKNGIQIKIYIE